MKRSTECTTKIVKKRKKIRASERSSDTVIAQVSERENRENGEEIKKYCKEFSRMYTHEFLV